MTRADLDCVPKSSYVSIESFFSDVPMKILTGLANSLKYLDGK